MRAILHLGFLMGSLPIAALSTALAADTKPSAAPSAAPPPAAATIVVAPALPAATNQLPSAAQTPAAVTNPLASSRPKSIRFQFRATPWKDVLDWFARQANFSLYMVKVPDGTWDYTGTSEYTPAEAIDFLNGVLATKGYTLLRRDRLLMVWDRNDPIPPGMLSHDNP